MKERSVNYPPQILENYDIKQLTKKWIDHYKRDISGEVILEVNSDNGVVVKKIIYYDHDFVNDILVKLQKLIDENKRYHSQLVFLKAKLQED